jgi:hemerythrin
MIDAFQPPRSLISWDDSWSLGIPVVDEQHQRLVGMVRTLQECLIGNDLQSDSLLFVLLDCIDYAMLHFAQEEELFLNANWPGSTKHMAEHEQFLLRTREILENFRTGDVELLSTTVDFLTHWLTNHILKSDVEFAQWIHERQ